MAFTTLILEDKNKITKEAPVGFSWTTLVFSFLVPLTRNDWKYALIMLVAVPCTLGISVFVIFPLIYNRIYIQSLVKNGFKSKKYHAIYYDKKRISQKEELSLIRAKVGININNLKVIRDKELEHNENAKETDHKKALYYRKKLLAESKKEEKVLRNTRHLMFLVIGRILLTTIILGVFLGADYGIIFLLI